MNDFEKHMTQYWTEEYPDVWSFLWSPEEAEKIPTEHNDQIHFLNENGTKLINEFLDSSKMTQGLPYEPFKKYFKTIDEFRVTENCDSEIKKWLYDKGIPFSKYVFIDCDRSGQSVMLTWKMVIKYWEGIFFADDIVIFDSSLEWGLFYYHESELYFGTDVIFDRKAEEQKTTELNELIKKITTAVYKKLQVLANTKLVSCLPASDFPSENPRPQIRNFPIHEHVVCNTARTNAP